MDILDLLRSDGSIVVNKKLAHEIGLVEAVIYSELVSLYKYWSDRGQLVEGEWFFCTFENLEKNTTIKERSARKFVNNLEKLGLIESKLKGLPSKKYYRITNGILTLLGLVPNYIGKNDRTDNNNGLTEKKAEKQLDNQVGNICRTTSAKVTELDRQNVPTNNTRTNNTNIKNINTFIDDDKRETHSPIHNEEDVNLIISNFRQATDGEVTDRSFNAVVRKVMDKYNQGKVNSFRDYLATALITKIEELEFRRMKNKAKESLTESAAKRSEERAAKLYSDELNHKIVRYNWLEN